MACFGAVHTPGLSVFNLKLSASPASQVAAALLPHQQPADRPDLLARVFRLQLKVLLDDLLKHHMLGRTQAHLYVIEFQKHGLPHAHILIILSPSDKLNSPDDYDRCAQFMASRLCSDESSLLNCHSLQK